MKIQEFRDMLKKCKRDDVEKIASELYKMMPKSKKEDEVDPLVHDIISGKAVTYSSKSKSSNNATVDYETLKKDILTFLNYVDNGYYYVPNRVVPKAKRSKWRFEVKNFIKAINEMPVDGENGAESALLLRKIYSRLCHGCGYYIFSSEDPFASIGMGQTVYYEMLIKRTFATGYTDENMRNMLLDATCTNLDRYTLHSDLEAIYVKSLPTTDLKYKAQELIKEYVKQFERELKTVRKQSHEFYNIQRKIKEMAATLLLTSIALCEMEAGLEYYYKNDKDTNKEVILFGLLYALDRCGEDKTWISVYEDGIARGIEPRDRLKEIYAEKIEKRGK